MCEDIHSPKLLICQPPAKTATVQHESLAVVVSEQLCATWSVLTRGSDAFSFFFFFFKHTQAVQHANNRNQFKPHSFIRQPGPAISSPMACLAAVLPSEMGDKCVCQCEGERERESCKERDWMKAVEKRKEKRGGERERADRAQGEMWWQHVSFW